MQVCFLDSWLSLYSLKPSLITSNKLKRKSPKSIKVIHFVLLVSFPVMTSSGPRFTVLSKSLMGLSTSAAATVNKVVGGVVTTPSGRPVMRVPPLNVSASQSSPSGNNSQQQQPQPQSVRIHTRQAQKAAGKAQSKEQPKSEFYLVIQHKCW